MPPYADDPSAVHELCEELLTAATEALDTIPDFIASPTMQGAPTRRYINNGVPAADCPDQLVVWASAVRTLPRGGDGESGDTSTTFWVNGVELHVQILRCLPTPTGVKKIVPATELQANARQSNADCWALWNHLHNLRAAELLFQGCSVVRWDGMTTVEPSGGAGGWELVVTAQLDGYGEVLGS